MGLAKPAPAPATVVALMPTQVAVAHDTQLVEQDVAVGEVTQCAQRRRFDREPAGEALFDRTALKAALPEVSKARYERTLCAEQPALKAMLDKLEGEKTQQTPATLSKIWRVSESEALGRAEKLTDVGFFQKRGSKEQPLFWVPFLYRDALKMVQGQAEQ